MTTVRRSVSDSAIALFSTVTVTADALTSTINAGARLAAELERRSEARYSNVLADLALNSDTRLDEITADAIVRKKAVLARIGTNDADLKMFANLRQIAENAANPKPSA